MQCFSAKALPCLLCQLGLSILITCVPFLTTRDTRQSELRLKRRKNKIYHPYTNTQATRQPELQSNRRKNKIYHSSTHTQCFSAKALPCLLCQLGHYILTTCVPFSITRHTRQPELQSKRRKNKIYYPYTHSQATRQTELQSNRRKNKIYHYSKQTQCFSAKALTCPLCQLGLSILLTCVPFLATRDTRQSELRSKGRKNKIYHPYTHMQATRQPELQSNRRKNKIYHSSTYTQCFLAKALPCLLCQLGLYILITCVPFFTTQHTRQPELRSKQRKKQDISSLHTYTGYAAARAPVEPKKKQDISFFHIYAVFLS